MGAGILTAFQEALALIPSTQAHVLHIMGSSHLTPVPAKASKTPYGTQVSMPYTHELQVGLEKQHTGGAPIAPVESGGSHLALTPALGIQQPLLACSDTLIQYILFFFHLSCRLDWRSGLAVKSTHTSAWEI